ncbi:hypothetical protein [Shewanella putrefaciens]|nr:hypothetical protein [Shewanella putrefaciens]
MSRSHGCERATMSRTVTYMPVLNPVSFRVSCSIEPPKVQCQEQG